MWLWSCSVALYLCGILYLLLINECWFYVKCDALLNLLFVDYNNLSIFYMLVDHAFALDEKDIYGMKIKLSCATCNKN